MDTKFNTEYIKESQLKEIMGLLESGSVVMTEKEYKTALDWIKKPTITASQADSFLKSLKSKQSEPTKKSTSLNELVEKTGGVNAKQ